jgi:putative ABC transport system ATP-binding protein
MKHYLVAVDLKKEYRHGAIGVPALRGVSLRVTAGELIGICGPSGSGKSTLLHVLAGLDRPDSGRIEIDGAPINVADESKRATLLGTEIGFVFQSFNLVPVLSARENVELPLWPKPFPEHERRSMAETMLARVGLKDRMDHRPDALSGGQQQRVAIARALVGKPSIVFADEPTANLDSKTAEDLLQLLAELNRDLGTTFIFSTHDQKTIRFASRIVLMHDGEVRA